jgi:6,7-dimethyl-8-ribityllumazine synthase
MASTVKNLSSYQSDQIPSGEGKSIGIALAEWNDDITFPLYDACVDTLIKHGVKMENIYTKVVPGTFELPFAAKQIAIEEKVDALICIGCVIKGETDHDVYINQSVSFAIMQLGLALEKTMYFRRLTPNNHQQAIDRAGGKHGNKGVEAAVTALRMIGLKKDKKVRMGFK